MKIGVLALQGAIQEHLNMVAKAGAEAIPIKKVSQLDEIDGIIIPGGESTTIARLMRQYDFTDALSEFSNQGKPMLGTCAGLIVLADEIVGEDAHLRLMNMKVIRNAFGRQKDSFEADINIADLDSPFTAVFIRAPIIESYGSEVDVLSTYQGQVVAARQNHIMATSFHPELTDDARIHGYFADMVRESTLVK